MSGHNEIILGTGEVFMSAVCQGERQGVVFRPTGPHEIGARDPDWRPGQKGSLNAGDTVIWCDSLASAHVLQNTVNALVLNMSGLRVIERFPPTGEEVLPPPSPQGGRSVIELDFLRKAVTERSRDRTHTENCYLWSDHRDCAISRLLDEVVLLQTTLGNVLNAWRDDANQGDGIMEEHADIYLKGRKLVPTPPATASGPPLPPKEVRS